MLSSEYHVENSDEVNMALVQTTDKYIESIQFRAFEKIQDTLVYSQEEYVDETTANIGSEGLSEFEVEAYDLIGSDLVERDDNQIIYILKYNISLSATSCEYCGRDDDTKEIITSPENSHTFEGFLEIKVTWVLDDFVDLIYDDDFDDAEIVSCELRETEFISGLDGEWESAENYCPRCGNPMTFEK